MSVPTLVLPDEQTWTMSGSDPAGEPVFEPARARRVLLPDRVPDALAGPLAEVLASLPREVATDDRRVPYPGEATAGRRERAPDRGEGHGDGHGEHDGHDHGDMMAIVGEPSADGLVMEPIELRLGPLGTPLPAGIVAAVTLDGDVVAEAGVGTVLGGDVRRDTPDPLSPKAWDLALGRAAGERWTRIAAVEVERAVSHTAWLRAFARVLGWRELIDASTGALAPLAAARGLEPGALADARRGLEALAGMAESSRRLRWRTAGRGRVAPERARQLGLRGPSARACGLPDDARSGDPLYRHLAFAPVVRSEGDALARTQVRAAEAVAAVELAVAALGMGTDGPPADRPVAVEGPRGPLRVDADGRLEAPGETAAFEAAGAAMMGSEWAAALTVLASFDLSPWRVASEAVTSAERSGDERPARGGREAG